MFGVRKPQFLGYYAVLLLRASMFSRFDRSFDLWQEAAWTMLGHCLPSVARRLVSKSRQCEVYWRWMWLVSWRCDRSSRAAAAVCRVTPACRWTAGADVPSTRRLRRRPPSRSWCRRDWTRRCGPNWPARVCRRRGCPATADCPDVVDVARACSPDACSPCRRRHGGARCGSAWAAQLAGRVTVGRGARALPRRRRRQWVRLAAQRAPVVAAASDGRPSRRVVVSRRRPATVQPTYTPPAAALLHGAPNKKTPHLNRFSKFFRW